MIDEDTARWTLVGAGLLDFIRARYALRWEGIHGIGHWERVRDNGLFLAERTGADVEVVEFFAALHDSRRLDDGHDPAHGPRAAELVRTLPASLLPLSPAQVDALAEACRTHTSGTDTEDPTIATCWDADRLDLWRVGIVPDPRYLLTGAAAEREVIEWAMERSTG